jgi:hypothetical protein
VDKNDQNQLWRDRSARFAAHLATPGQRTASRGAAEELKAAEDHERFSASFCSSAALRDAVFWFFVDLVAGRLLLARSDPVDEWLQVALALSIEIFWRDPPHPVAITKGPAVSTDRSGDQRQVRSSCTSPRIDGWMAIICPIHEGGETHGGQGGLDSPDDAVDEAFRHG